MDLVIEPRPHLEHASMATPVNFASGSEQSYVVRYEQDLSGTYDITWINAPVSMIAKDIFGNPIDFNKDGLTDTVFLGGLVNEYIGYERSTDSTIIAASRLPQGEVALGGGRDGGPALRVINIGPSGSHLSGMPNTQAPTGALRGAVLDIDKDGYQDIITMGDSGIRTWIYEPSSSTFRRAYDNRFASSLSATGDLSIGDFNADGAPDVIITNYEFDTTISPARGGQQPASSYSIYFGERDGASNWNHQFLKSGSITLDIPSIPKTGTARGNEHTGAIDVTPVVRDFDGDGDLDLALSTDTGIRIYANPGNGVFDPNSGINIAGINNTPALFLKTADVNNDGKLDIISSPNGNSVEEFGTHQSTDTYNQPITLYLNDTPTNGTLSFTTRAIKGAQDLSAVNGPIATGDMNLDGNIDLVIAPHARNGDRFLVSLGDGLGNFGVASIWTGYSNQADPLRPIDVPSKNRNIMDIDTGDFDGDGQLDVLSLAGYQVNSVFDAQGNGLNHIYGVAYNRTYTPPSITTTALPAGSAGAPYSTQLQATGGDSSKAYSFQLSAGSPALPAGLSLQPDGTISGTPQSTGSFSFLANVTQANGLSSGVSQIAVNVSSAAGGGGGSTGGGGSSSGGSGSSGGGSGSSSGGSGSTGGGGSSGGGTISTPNGSGGTTGLDNDNLDESPENHNGLIIDANKDGVPDATQSNVAGIKRVGDGRSQGDFAALAVGSGFTLNAVTLRPIVNNQVNVSLPSGGSIDVPIPQGITALLEPLEFFVEGVTPGATIEAELFIPDNFNEQTDAYMRFNYKTQRFEEYVDANGQKLYQLLDEDGDGKVDRILFSLTDGDPAWDGDRLANGTIIDPGSPIDAAIDITGGHKRDRITGNLLANTIHGKGGNDHLGGDLGRDVINGGKGHDRITGGEHGDYLKGGAGRDRFIYHSAADSSATNPYQRDKIARFQKSDRIDLRRIDADITLVGIQRFDFIGKSIFSGQGGELRFHAGLLSGDLDGDRQADFAVAIDGKLHANQLLL